MLKILGILLLFSNATLVFAQELDLRVVADGELVKEYYRRAARISELTEKQALWFQELGATWAIQNASKQVLTDLKRLQFPMVTRLCQISGLAKAINSKLIESVPSSRDESAKIHRADLAVILTPDKIAESILQNVKYLRDTIWKDRKNLSPAFQEFIEDNGRTELALESVFEAATSLSLVEQEFNRRLLEFK